MGRHGREWEGECYGQGEGKGGRRSEAPEESGLEEARGEKAHVGLEQAGRASWKRWELDPNGVDLAGDSEHE